MPRSRVARPCPRPKPTTLPLRTAMRRPGEKQGEDSATSAQGSSTWARRAEQAGRRASWASLKPNAGQGASKAAMARKELGERRDEGVSQGVGEHQRRRSGAESSQREGHREEKDLGARQGAARVGARHVEEDEQGLDAGEPQINERKRAPAEEAPRRVEREVEERLGAGRMRVHGAWLGDGALRLAGLGQWLAEQWSTVWRTRPDVGRCANGGAYARGRRRGVSRGGARGMGAGARAGKLWPGR